MAGRCGEQERKVQFLNANFAVPYLHNVCINGWYKDKYAFERYILANYLGATGIHIFL
jgi:hypothetical protein